MAGDLVFAVASTSDVLGRASRPPADVAQPPAAFGQRFGIVHDRIDLGRGGFRRGAVLVGPPREQTQPSPSHLLIAPGLDQVRSASQDQMQVIAEHRVGQAIDGKDRSEELQPLSDPCSAMFVANAGVGIVAAKKRAA